MYLVSERLKAFTLALVALVFTALPFSAQALEELDDDQLAGVLGQALFVANSQTLGGLEFTSVALDVELELNTNISQLQLGCGGINGAGACDIDIDNLSLTGPATGICAGNRVDCSAILTRPFIEFAIQNPTSPTQREIVGFRLSAENMSGLLTAGENSAVPNGINRLSGYVEIAATGGTAVTAPGLFGTQNDEQINTVADLNILACTSGCGSNRPLFTIPGSSAGINIPSVSAPFTVPAFTINGTRLESVTVSANSVIPDIRIEQSDGSLATRLAEPACVLYFVCIQDTTLFAGMTVQGLNADITFTEDLGFVHNLPVNNPFYLAFQKQNVQWPGAVEVAQRGWWLSLQDEVDLGTLNPANQVDITSAYPQLAILLGDALSVPPNKVVVTTGDGLEALFGDGIRKEIGNVDLSTETVFINLQDLQLDSAQDVVSNCRGGGYTCFY